MDKKIKDLNHRRETNTNMPGIIKPGPQASPTATPRVKVTSTPTTPSAPQPPKQ